MKKVASIFLRPEIYPCDIEQLIKWMENPKITCYLNEDKKVVDELRGLLDSVPAPMLTLKFNQRGRFFLVCNNNGDALGFIKLKNMREADSYEIVVAIGDRELWGKGYGSGAICMALQTAFFEWRAKKVVAKIYADNHRSINMMCSCGFICEQHEEPMLHYRVTMNEYLKQIRQ